MPFLDLVMFSTKVKETALEKGECLTHAHWFILHMQPWLSPCQLSDCLFALSLSSSCSSRPPLIHVLFGVSISLFSLTFFLICLQGSDTKIFTFLFDLTQSSVPKIPMLQKISQFFCTGSVLDCTGHLELSYRLELCWKLLVERPSLLILVDQHV